MSPLTGTAGSATGSLSVQNRGRDKRATLIVPAGQFRMWRVGETPSSDPWGVRCLLGPERPTIVRGYGGYGQIARQGRRAVSTFEGSETPAMSITLLVEPDTILPGGIDKTVRNLERMWGWAGVADDDPPPPVRWAANVPRDFSEAPNREWVCESAEWGDSNSDDRGNLLWIQATMVLAVYRDTGVNVKPRKSFPRHTLHKGDTLKQYARKWLNDPRRWRDVADLNRDNPRCPRTPEHPAKRDVVLLTPLKEPGQHARARERFLTAQAGTAAEVHAALGEARDRR